ncbi:hypothetical protein Gotur_004220 [Gossypium turneri]
MEEKEDKWITFCKLSCNMAITTRKKQPN